MACEMCGAEGYLVHALVESVELKVCKKCSSFGKIIRKPVVRNAKKIPPKPTKEMIQVIRDDFADIIRKKREKMGLKQMEFAKFLSEKESLVHKIEAGEYTPSISLARKMEKQLGITLVEQKELESQNLKTSTETYTIGDVLKIK